MNKENYSEEIIKLIKFVILIVIVLIIFYGITKYVNEHRKISDKTETTNSVIQYDEIIMGNVFEQKEPMYYVLAETAENPYKNLFSTYKTAYNKKSDSYGFYTVNLSNAFNKDYFKKVSDFTSNYPILKETTLLKIENGVVTEHYEGDQIVLEQLKIISK